MYYIEGFAQAFTTAMTWAVVGIIGGILLGKIIGAYVEGNAGIFESVFLGGIFLILLINTILAPSVYGKLVYALLAVFCFLFLPFLLDRLSKAQDKRFYDERIRQFREVLELDPTNLAARERLVDALRRRGFVEEAVKEQVELVRLRPGDKLAARKLELLRQEADELLGPVVVCRQCGHENRRRDVRCRKCEAALSVSGELAHWLRHGGFRHVALAWAVAIVMMTLVLFAASGLQPPVRLLLSLMILMVVIGAEFFYVYRRL